MPATPSSTIHAPRLTTLQPQTTPGTGPWRGFASTRSDQSPEESGRTSKANVTMDHQHHRYATVADAVQDFQSRFQARRSALPHLTAAEVEQRFIQYDLFPYAWSLLAAG